MAKFGTWETDKFGEFGATLASMARVEFIHKKYLFFT
jgi:hypothetical protein